MGEKPARGRRITLRAILVYLFTAAAVAGFGYLMYVFYNVPFLRPWLKWTLIASDAALIVFCVLMCPRLARSR